MNVCSRILFERCSQSKQNTRRQHYRTSSHLSWVRGDEEGERKELTQGCGHYTLATKASRPEFHPGTHILKSPALGRLEKQNLWGSLTQPSSVSKSQAYERRPSWKTRWTIPKSKTKVDLWSPRAFTRTRTRTHTHTKKIMYIIIISHAPVTSPLESCHVVR